MPEWRWSSLYHPKNRPQKPLGVLERAEAVGEVGLDHDAARRAQHHTDGARHRYVHHLYHRNVADPRYYHLVIDATAVPWATCVEIIVAAVQGRDELRRLGELSDDDTA